MTSIELLYQKMLEAKGMITFEEFLQAEELYIQELHDFFHTQTKKSFEEYFDKKFNKIPYPKKDL
jgi:hypothetical protein